MTSLTYYKDDLLGNHTLKVGLEYHDVGLDVENRYNGSPYPILFDGQEWNVYPFYIDQHWNDCYTDEFGEEQCPYDPVTGEENAVWWETIGEDGGVGPDGIFHDAGADPFQRLFDSGDFGIYDGEYWTGYIQDEWRIMPNLTFKPGLRVDRSIYWNDIGEEVVSFDMVQPRLGFAWDIFNNAKTVLRTYWGRFMHPGALALPYWLKDAPTVNGVEVSALPGAYNAGFFDDDGNPDFQTYCEFFGYDCNEEGFYVDENQTSGGLPNEVVSTLKPTYADEFSIGIEREIMPRTGLELTYVSKRTKDIIEDICYGTDADGNVVDPGDSSTWPLDEDGNPYWSFAEHCDYWIVDNPDIAKRYYYGYIMKLESRYKDWFHVIFNYTYSKSQGSIEWTQFSGGDLDFPLLFDNIYGYMSDDRRHRIKINGYFYMPMDFSMGFNFFWGSGLTQSFTTNSNWYTELPYGSYFIESRGSRRNPSIYTLDMEFRKDFKLSDRIDGRVILSVVNVINNQQSTDRCYSFHGITFGEGYIPGDVLQGANGSCGYWNFPDRPASWGMSDAWLTPRSYEVGFRLEF